MKYRKDVLLPIEKIQKGIKYTAITALTAEAGALTAVGLFGCDKKKEGE